MLKTYFAFSWSIGGVKNEEAVQSRFTPFQHVVYCSPICQTACSIHTQLDSGQAVQTSTKAMHCLVPGAAITQPAAASHILSSRSQSYLRD